MMRKALAVGADKENAGSPCLMRCGADVCGGRKGGGGGEGRAGKQWREREWAEDIQRERERGRGRELST